MLILGIAGGIASGKTEVAKLFEALGAVRVSADEIGHQVLEESEVQEALFQRWGKRVFDGSNLDRTAIGSIVFGESSQAAQELAFLESVTHPKIRKVMERRISEARDANKPAVLLDAAILFKVQWDRLCDYVLFVDVPRAIRFQRARARGWTEAEFNRRENSQISISEKKKRCHFVIDNKESLQQTQRQVLAVWNEIHSLSNSNPI